MMRENCSSHVAVNDVGNQSVPFLGVGANLGPFATAQTCWFPEDRFGHAELAYVVELSPQVGPIDRCGVETQFHGDGRCNVGRALAVTCQIRIAQSDHFDESGHQQ